MRLLRQLIERIRMPAPPVAPAPAGDPREFLLGEVELLLREDPAVRDVHRLPEHYGFSLRRDGKESRLFLDNLFAETRELSPEQRRDAAREFLSKLASTDDVNLDSWEEVEPHLLMVLRAATHGLSAGIPGPGKELLARSPLPHLIEALVVDMPGSLRYAQAEQLQRWGVGLDDAFAAATRNLEEGRWSGVELYDRHPSPIWHIASDDTYESSRLLLPGFLASFADRVEGRPIAIVPERGTLMISGDASPGAVERLCESAEREYASSSRSISPALYTVDEAGRVVPYLPGGMEPLAQRVRLAHVELAVTEYEVQRAALEADHAKRGVDLFVANYNAVERRSDRRLITYCTWPEGVEGLLPEAELVALSVEGELVRFVTWDQVQQLAPHCLARVPGLWPACFRIVRWPEPELLAQLLAVSVTLETYEVT